MPNQPAATRPTPAPPAAAPAEPCVCGEPGGRCPATVLNKSRTGYFYCSLPAGHDGDHVACGGEGFHRLATWPQVQR